ncbi:hypothetical protein B0H14DRAFT_2555902 [Mycena olivaceomarginata]|nr:hypothetical protein B0H14DRAFT_2555902 [Mycena olivaceomarginata]
MKFLLSIARLALLLFVGVPAVLAHPITVCRSHRAQGDILRWLMLNLVGRAPVASELHNLHHEEEAVSKKFRPHFPFRKYPSEQDDEALAAARSAVYHDLLGREENVSNKILHLPFRHYPSEKDNAELESLVSRDDGDEHLPFSQYPSEE